MVRQQALGDRIRRLRLSRGLSLDALAAAAGVTKQAISKYEHHRAMPSPRVLTALACALGTKAIRLWGPPAADVHVIAFRKVARVGKREQERVEAAVVSNLERRVQLAELTGGDGEVGALPASFPASSFEDCEEAAARVRERWELGSDPIASVTDVLEMHGIHVLLIDAAEGVDGVSAVAESSDGIGAIAVMSKTELPGERQRLNLAHELGHLVLSISPGMDDEKAAFRFAGAFLAPAAPLRRDAGTRRTALGLDELLLLKGRYGMSLQALVYRLRDLEVINAAQAASLWRQINARGWRRHEPGELPPETPTWVERTALRALHEGSLSPAEFKELTGRDAGEVPPSAVRRLMASQREGRERALAAGARRLAEHYEKDEAWREVEGGDLGDA